MVQRNYLYNSDHYTVLQCDFGLMALSGDLVTKVSLIGLDQMNIQSRGNFIFSKITKETKM